MSEVNPEALTLQAQLDQLNATVQAKRQEVGIADHPILDAINQLNYQMRVLLKQIFPDPTDELQFHIFVEQTKLTELEEMGEQLRATQEEMERQQRMATLAEGVVDNKGNPLS